MPFRTAVEFQQGIPGIQPPSKVSPQRGELLPLERVVAFFAAGKNAISVIYVRQKVAKLGQLTMAAAERREAQAAHAAALT